MSATDHAPVPLSLDEIEAISDETTLATWYRERSDFGLHLQDQASAHRDALGQDADFPWLRRIGAKMGHNRTCMARIERRMIVLGFNPPYPPADPRAREIRKLLERNQALRDVLREHQIDYRAGGEEAA